MVDISIVNGIINQLITGGAPPCISQLLLDAGEGPPTLQSTVIPAWNYAPQLLGKVTPTFSPIVNAARK